MTETTPAVQSAIVERFAAATRAGKDQDPQVTAMQILERIVESESLADLFGDSGAIHAKDLIGVPFVLVGIKFNESTMQGDGPDFYGVLDAVDDDGVPFVMTCGAVKVMARAWRAQDLDLLPVRVKLTQADQPTAGGFYPMDLELVP